MPSCKASAGKCCLSWASHVVNDNDTELTVFAGILHGGDPDKTKGQPASETTLVQHKCRNAGC